MSVSSWSTTPSNNKNINGINIDEHCPAGNLNDAIRNVMADSKTKFDEIDDKITTVTVSGSGNAITSLSANNGKITATKGSTFLVSSDIIGKQDSNTAVTHIEATEVGSETQPVYVNMDGSVSPTTYSLAKSVPSDAIFTDTITTVSSTITGSGNAITDISSTNGVLSLTKGSTFLTEHPSVSTSTDTTSTDSPAFGGTFTVVDDITRDTNGHVTTINTKTITLPTETGVNQDDFETLENSIKSELANSISIAFDNSHEAISANSTYTVPEYVMGQHRVQVFIDGAVTQEGDTWSEYGTGTTSTAIKFLTDIDDNKDIGIRVLQNSTYISPDNAMHLTGEESVTGNKSFTGSLTAPTQASTDNSTKVATTAFVQSAITNKQDKATTLSGYGITDAKIANGTITLGSNSVTPLTSHQDISGKANLSGASFTGAVSFADNISTTGSFGTAVEMLGADVDLSKGTVFSKDILLDTEFTFKNVISSKTNCFSIILTDGGSSTVTWPSNVRWAGGTAPDLTASGVDVITFLTPNGGTTWYGVPSVLDAKEVSSS